MVKRFYAIFLGIALIANPVMTLAVSPGEQVEFFVDPAYDLYGREQLRATLQLIGMKTYFYIDDKWWNGLGASQKEQVRQALQELDTEFYRRIYPTLTLDFGSEWNPGIDKDARITILCHPLVENAAGYFNAGDEYPRLQNFRSNEREMFYFNSDLLTDPLAKSFLAHEFVHLITFNQKERAYGPEEEVWLNEARAELASTLVGYDADYEGSNLERRVKTFLESPSDSLTEWQGKPADYGALNLFTQYLVEQYGLEVLVNSLRSKETGIASINKALKEQGIEADFGQIFTDWTITVLANDCNLGEKYCYQNPNLKQVRVTPSINFLPLQGKSSLGVTQSTKNWSGNWFKFVGSQGTLKVEMIGNPENLFVVPYLARDLSGKYSLGYFQLDEYQRGQILVPDFGTKVSSVVIMPSIQSKISGFDNPEPAFSYFWEASTIIEVPQEKIVPIAFDKPIAEMTKQELLTMIGEVEALLGRMRDQLAMLDSQGGEEKPLPISCQRFEQDLFYGMKNENQVMCLQELLKNQGSDIYPEGLVTGNFLGLTRAAVVRFQERFSADILAPLGLDRGTGYVGEKTRDKLNQMLAG